MAEEIKNDRIRRRAYELWEQEGRPDGREVEFWVRAERELYGDMAEVASPTDEMAVMAEHGALPEGISPSDEMATMAEHGPMPNIQRKGDTMRPGRSRSG